MDLLSQKLNPWILGKNLHSLFILTPKIPYGFWIKLGSFVHSWRNSKKLNAKNEGFNHRILNLPWWTSTSKSYSFLFLRIYKIITIKDQSILIFWIISYSEVLHSRNSWKLDVFGESSQPLGGTSKSSYPCTAQVLALNV
jgi:hypothetical protein